MPTHVETKYEGLNIAKGKLVYKTNSRAIRALYMWKAITYADVR